ncbi:hypothetical protein ACJMK2_012419 [Sinanodonta woodiana]|uniref:Uncharacterized protein n=1 Tax=Sinanodonta woodiana TaxID=1069815 RepID=A0ABD3VAG1_SINWO
MAQKIDDTNKEMGLKDDIYYTSIEVRFESYPRIKHFQSELQDLFRRFLGFYEQLPECLKHSGHKLNSLKNDVHLLTNVKPVLFLFGNTHSKIPKADLIKKYKVPKHDTHQMEELQAVDEKKHKLVIAICTLRMMDTKKGTDTLLKVRDCFGEENMIFFVDECKNDLVVNNLARLENLLKLSQERMNVVYQQKKEISAAISNLMEHKFIHAFQSLNLLLQEITQKRSPTHGPTFGGKGTGGRFYKEIKTFLENPLTILDILMISSGRTAEEKLTTAIIRFVKTVLTRELARTYRIQDTKVFDYLQKENYEPTWIKHLESHISPMTFITKFQKVIERPNDALAIYEVKNQYTSDDAKTLGKEVTKVLMGYVLKVGTAVKNIRINLDSLIFLRKELMRIMEETISEVQYEDCIPEIDKWKERVERIKDIQSCSHMFGKLCVFVQHTDSRDREKEVRMQIGKYLIDYPGEYVVEVVSQASFSGRYEHRNCSKIVMGDGFLNKYKNRGTIGLFMYKDGDESNDLHFVTSSHTVLYSDEVKTNDIEPVCLGKTSHLLTTEDGLIDIAAIRIERKIRPSCNVFFEEDNEMCESMILDMEGIRKLKEGKHVFKRGSETGETKGCIISQVFRDVGIQKHNFLVGLLAEPHEPADNRVFAREGDSGAVVYTKTPDGEVQYIAILMGKLDVRPTEDQSYLSFTDLAKRVGPPIMTTCLQEGLNKLEQKFGVKLTLPKHIAQ